MLQKWLSVDCFWLVVFLIFESLSISLVIHIIFFQGLELPDVLIPFKFIFIFDTHYLIFEFLSSFLFLLNRNNFLASLLFMPFDLLFERGQHLLVVLLLSSQHIDLTFELVIVCHRIIEGRYCLIQICLQVFNLCLQHNIVSFAILFFELVELSLFFLVFLSYRFEIILDSKEFPFLLFKLASVVINLPLEGFELGFCWVDRVERFIDRGVCLEAWVHIISFIFLKQMTAYKVHIS